MYVNQKLKMIFFHNPKSAGRSAIEMLGFKEEVNTKFIHMTAVDAKRRIFQEEWSNYYSLSFVRNPWDRMVSLYFYHRSLDYGFFQGFNHSHQLARLYSFAEWLAFNATSKRKSNWFGQPQTLWTEDVAEIFRFEEFEAGIKKVCKKFDLAFAPTHKNESERNCYREYYPTQKEMDIVAQADSETIKRFGYEF